MPTLPRLTCCGDGTRCGLINPKNNRSHQLIPLSRLDFARFTCLTSFGGGGRLDHLPIRLRVWQGPAQGQGGGQRSRDYITT